MTAWQRLRIEATYLRHVRCAVLFHSSTTNCCNCLTFLWLFLLISRPITSQICSKGVRSGEQDGYGRRFTLLACKSAIVVRAEWQGAPSCIRRISLLHKAPCSCIVYGIKMHISQFKFVPEFWLKTKERHYSLEDKTRPSIWYTVCLQYV